MHPGTHNDREDGSLKCYWGLAYTALGFFAQVQSGSLVLQVQPGAGIDWYRCWCPDLGSGALTWGLPEGEPDLIQDRLRK